MIDLHAHTTQSDGTLTPEELVSEAMRLGLEALAITDHDTFDGYDQAAKLAKHIELVCGIELSTNWESRSVHLLAYFPDRDPGSDFRAWVSALSETRWVRNRSLVETLRNRGFQIDLEYLSQRFGSRICRPHFAAAMIEKGYVASTQEAFERYLGETGSCFVARDEPDCADAISKIRSKGGVPVLAHPGRIERDPSRFATCLDPMRRAGLLGLEAYHSDHTIEEQDGWAALARDRGLIATGGSDFHGANKPKVRLGTGVDGNVRVPYALLNQLRSIA